MVKTVSWGPADITGGPVDEILAALRDAFPGLRIERLSVTRSGDDDNVWFISRKDGLEVQLDSASNGEPPFLLESDTARERADEVGLAVETLTEWLRG
ncbi:hypothetical protein [Streptomyces tateyamensis]|uniref:hypothetical protein n=1 Tax=Streptomyces tateyamensis TaxID=565073 RepID=UPI0011B3D33E|nr:hypothetical protein [Streptomyces tateyamensis]